MCSAKRTEDANVLDAGDRKKKPAHGGLTTGSPCFSQLFDPRLSDGRFRYLTEVWPLR